MTTEEEQPAPSGRRGKGYFLPGFIALLALLGLGLFVGAGDLEHPVPRTLDGTEIAAQISLGIQAAWHTVAPPQVTCPAKEPVRVGQQFDCTMSGHPPTTVQVREVDGRGRIEFYIPT